MDVHLFYFHMWFSSIENIVFVHGLFNHLTDDKREKNKFKTHDSMFSSMKQIDKKVISI